MKTLKLIGIILVVIIAIIIGWGMTLSGESHLERSITINAPIEKVFSSVNSFKDIKEWSPWARMDPNIILVYSGPESGIGAKYDWESEDENVGIGSQVILESRENEYVKTQMIFAIEGEFFAEFILKPIDGGTEVTWTYDGKVESLMWKFIMLSMEGELGPMYEKGLADLKTYIEAKPNYSINIEEINSPGLPYIGIRVKMPTESEKIGETMGQLYGKLMGHMQMKGIEMAGMPMTIYYFNDDGSLDMECALPTTEIVKSTNKEISSNTTYAGKLVKGTHYGDYNELEVSHRQLMRYVADNSYNQAGAMYEIYVTDPGTEPDTAKWQTDIYIPINN